MIKGWLRALHRHSRRLWVRIALISALSLLAIGLAKPLGPLIPEWMAEAIGANALDRLLSLIASSMLAVTTFSVTIMVSVYLTSASQWTPRAHLALLKDGTTQTVLATFIGAYIYALASIILVSTPFFGNQELVVLYVTTIFVLALIVTALVRWILRLRSLGSLLDTAGRIEEEARLAIEARMVQPFMGAKRFDPNAIADGAVPVRAKASQYLQNIYVDTIQDCATEQEAEVYIVAPIGRFVVEGEVVAYLSRDDETLMNGVLAGFEFGTLRTLENDPRFGLIQLSEIASKALSPGINDPGTAIDISGRLTRLLMGLSNEEPEVTYDRVWIAPLPPEDIVEDAFAAIARDASDQVEVLIHVIKNLYQLGRHAAPEIAAAASDMADTVRQRGEHALTFGPDLDRLAAAVKLHGQPRAAQRLRG